MPAVGKAETVSANVGLSEFIDASVPKHFGVYPYAAISLVEPFEKWYLVYTFGVEYTPEQGNWGFFASFTADRPMNNLWGIDALVTVLHDQHEFDWHGAGLWIGAGVGTSVYMGKLTVSLSIQTFAGVNIDGWALMPGLNFGWTL